MKRIISLMITAAILLGACAAFPACAGGEENQPAEPQEARPEPEVSQNKGLQGQETPQEEAPQIEAGGEEPTVKEITRDDGTVEVWEFVGVFGSKEDLLKAIGAEKKGEPAGADGGTAEIGGITFTIKTGEPVRQEEGRETVDTAADPEQKAGNGLSWSKGKKKRKNLLEITMKVTNPAEKNDEGPVGAVVENQEGKDEDENWSAKKINRELEKSGALRNRSRKWKRRLKEIREKTVDVGEVKVIFLQENRGSGR